MKPWVLHRIWVGNGFVINQRDQVSLLHITKEETTGLTLIWSDRVRGQMSAITGDPMEVTWIDARALIQGMGLNVYTIC